MIGKEKYTWEKQVIHTTIAPHPLTDAQPVHEH